MRGPDSLSIHLVLALNTPGKTHCFIAKYLAYMQSLSLVYEGGYCMRKCIPVYTLILSPLIIYTFHTLDATVHYTWETWLSVLDIS